MACRLCPPIPCDPGTDFNYSLETALAKMPLPTTAKAVDCTIPDDLGLYSLQSGWRFRSQTFYFVPDCPPGYPCDSTVIVITPGDIGDDVTVPPDDLDPTGERTIHDFTFSLYCCQRTVIHTIPAGTNHSSAFSMMQTWFHDCARATAQCVSAERTGTVIGGRSWVGVPGPIQPSACKGVKYQSTIGTASPLSNIELYSGAMPPGLELGQTALQFGTISGTPTTGGNYSFSLKLTAINGTSTIANYAITVIQINTDATTGIKGVPYSYRFTAIGGAEPMDWAVVEGALPAGLSLLANGLVTGIPTTKATYNFKVRVSDANGRMCSSDITIDVICQGPNWTDLGAEYSETFAWPAGPPTLHTYHPADIPIPVSAIAINCICHKVCDFSGVPSLSPHVFVLYNMVTLFTIKDFDAFADTTDIPFTIPAGQLCALRINYGHTGSAPDHWVIGATFENVC